MKVKKLRFHPIFTPSPSLQTRLILFKNRGSRTLTPLLIEVCAKLLLARSARPSTSDTRLPKLRSSSCCSTQSTSMIIQLVPTRWAPSSLATLSTIHPCIPPTVMPGTFTGQEGCADIPPVLSPLGRLNTIPSVIAPPGTRIANIASPLPEQSSLDTPETAPLLPR